MLLYGVPQRGKKIWVSNGIWTCIYKLLDNGRSWVQILVRIIHCIVEVVHLRIFFTWLKCKELNWLDGHIKLMYVKWALFCIFCIFFFTRHVSDKDRQSKLYRNVQPVFSIDDEDEDGGIDLTVWCNWFQSECMKRSCRRITANWDSISITQQMVVTLEGSNWQEGIKLSILFKKKNLNSLWKEFDLPEPILTNQTVIETRNMSLCVCFRGR